MARPRDDRHIDDLDLEMHESEDDDDQLGIPVMDLEELREAGLLCRQIRGDW